MNEKLYEYLRKLNLKLIEPLNYEITCGEKIDLTDELGYKYKLSKSNLSTIVKRKSSPAQFFNLNPYTKENIKNYLIFNEIKIDLKTDNFQNVTAKTKLIFSCPLHGEFQKSWNEIKNGAYCPICGRIKCANIKRNKIEDIRKGFLKFSYELVSEDYINNEKPLEYICSKHKDYGVQKLSWGNLITGQRCCCCSRESFLESITKSHEEFIKEINNMYGNKFIFIGEYTGNKNKIRMYCNDCKTEFNGSPNHLLEGHLGCRCKQKSQGEYIINDFLAKKKIIFDKEFRIKKCRNKKPLPFDFAIFEDKERTQLKGLIEFQGKQHYEDTGWEKDKNKGREKLELQKINDKIKKQYCIDNNIKLLIIPYWEIRNIHKLVSNFIDNI